MPIKHVTTIISIALSCPVFHLFAAEKTHSGKPSQISQSSRVVILSLSDGRNRWHLPIQGNHDSWLVAVSRIGRGEIPREVQLKASLASRKSSNGRASNIFLAFTPPGSDTSIVKTGHRVARPAFPSENKIVQKSQEFRTFYVQTHGGSSDDPSQYETVKSRLITSGKMVNVYLDTTENADTKRKTADEIVKILDLEIPARVVPRIGTAADIDGDGKLAVLLTSALSRLADGRMAIDGFVRPTDFDPAGTLPRSHAADVIFINSRVSDSGFLKSLLAHEFTHAVAATARRHQAEHSEAEVEEEESWLEEGLAHLSERWVEGSWANLNYRISAYYESPENNQLIVNDQAGLGNGRSHGHRGAAYLFLKWCEETYGSSLPRRLIESQLTGIKNLENATGVEFEELFRGWSAKLMGEIAGDGSIEAVKNQALLDDWLAGIPRETSMALDSQPEIIRWEQAATTTRFFRLTAESAGMGTDTVIEIELSGANEEEFQLIAMPVRDRHLGMSLRVMVENSEVDQLTNELKMRLFIQNSDPRNSLTLQSAAWENHNLTRGNETELPQSGYYDILMIARQFGGYKIPPGESLLTPLISIPVNATTMNSQIHWKIVAHDESGRPVFIRANEEYLSNSRLERIAKGTERSIKPIQR